MMNYTKELRKKANYLQIFQDTEEQGTVPHSVSEVSITSVLKQAQTMHE